MGQIKQQRPLWQLLAMATHPKELASLSCAECFTLFELLADETYLDPGNPELIKAVKDHFVYCPDCSKYYLDRLDELEAEYLILHQPS